MRKILLVATVPLSLKAFSLGISFMKFLRKHGYEVSACASPGPEAEDIRRAGFTYHEVEIPRSISPILDYRALKKLTRLMLKERFDIVHTQTSKAGFIGRLAAYESKVPLIIHTAHNWSFHPLLKPQAKYFYLQLEKRAARWCDAIIVDTKAVREYGLRHNVADSSKVHQIYMGIDVERFRAYDYTERTQLRKKLGMPLDKVVIGCIARLVADKGLDTLLKCAHRFKESGDALFIIGGDGPLRASLSEQVKREGLQDTVIFIGHTQDVPAYLNTFDIFCLPTLREGFGVIFAEAAACGVPAVASDIAPLREVIIDGVTGKRVPVNDVDEFSHALRFFFEPSVRKQYAGAARQHVVDNFSLRQVHEKTFSLYKTLWKEKWN